MASQQHVESRSAPWVVLPETEIMSIEHPCIVKNISKATDMLGGPQQLSNSLEQGTRQSLSLNFNPNDPASRTILSLHNETNNVLLKVTVPKRTGRKRKRGTNGEFEDEVLATPNLRRAFQLFRSLHENSNNYSVEAVGNIKSCHVWRAIPDFVYFSKTSDFLQGIESHLLPQQYPRLKAWSFSKSYGLENTEVIPPPVFSTQSLTHNYTYRQNPAVRMVADPNTGVKVLHNRAASLRLHIQIHQFDDLNYPVTTSPECPPLEEQTQSIQDLVGQLSKLFDDRPIWTRRALINSLPLDAPTQLVRVAAAYLCYSLRSGPWRDAYVKFGVDPRTDPRYRKYQTILLKQVPKDRVLFPNRARLQRLWSRSPDTESHIFTGTKAVSGDGKTWQLCDLMDPVLKELVDVPDLYIRAECETRYFGWYANGTSAKMRILLKAKIDALADGNQIDQGKVHTFMQLPENWSPGAKPSGFIEPASGYLPEKSDRKELEWASAYRSICRTSAGGLPIFGGNGTGRSNKPKPKARPSYIRAEDELLSEERSALGEEQDGIETDAEAAAEYTEPEEAEDELSGDNEESMYV